MTAIELPTPSQDLGVCEGRASPRGILVVDDHDLVRLGVRALVQSQAPSGVTPGEVFEAGSLAEALRLYESERAAIGLVLLDLALPDSDGLGGLSEFHRRHPAARIVVLSGTSDSVLADGALAAGAIAFLPKSADLKEVVSFIRACGLLNAGQAQVDPNLYAPVSPAMAVARQQLTPRQSQVLQWLLDGKANREIAQLTNLSEGTVKNHVSTLLLQFGVRSRAPLISSLR